MPKFWQQQSLLGELLFRARILVVSVTHWIHENPLFLFPRLFIFSVFLFDFSFPINQRHNAPRISTALLAIASLAFTLLGVPLPAYHMTSGKWSLSFPSDSSGLPALLPCLWIDYPWIFQVLFAWNLKVHPFSTDLKLKKAFIYPIDS